MFAVGVRNVSLLIVSQPGMPCGVNAVAGTWPVWVMWSTIALRSIASAIARRWFTSVMFLTLKP